MVWLWYLLVDFLNSWNLINTTFVVLVWDLFGILIRVKILLCRYILLPCIVVSNNIRAIVPYILLELIRASEITTWNTLKTLIIKILFINIIKFFSPYAYSTFENLKSSFFFCLDHYSLSLSILKLGAQVFNHSNNYNNPIY